MRCSAIILGREGRPVYQNPLSHTSMPSIRIISMSTAGCFICRLQKPRYTQHKLGSPALLGYVLLAIPFDCISFGTEECVLHASENSDVGAHIGPEALNATSSAYVST